MAIQQDLDTGFHAAQARLFRRTVNHSRKLIYGDGAVLQLHRIKPSGTPELLAAFTEDWSIEQQFGGVGAQFWTGVIFGTAILEQVLSTAGTATVITHQGRTTIRFRIQSATRPADAAHSYQLTLTALS